MRVRSSNIRYRLPERAVRVFIEDRQELQKSYWYMVGCSAWPNSTCRDYRNNYLRLVDWSRARRNIHARLLINAAASCARRNVLARLLIGVVASRRGLIRVLLFDAGDRPLVTSMLLILALVLPSAAFQPSCHHGAESLSVGGRGLLLTSVAEAA